MLFSFKKLFSNKIVLIFTFFIVLAVIILPSIASAGMVEDIANGFVSVILDLGMKIPIFLLETSGTFLNWVTSGDFMKISMTNSGLSSGMPGYNPVVGIGWGLVRNLANIALVFGLVVIAMSIILGYQETAAKKMLVNFILIAVLINFTPVICGIMIDGANILMNSFLTGGVSQNLAIEIQNTIKNGNAVDIPTMAVLAIFCIFAAAIYMLYAVLFLTRYIMLWILIIVSPIAFATFVFPKSNYIKKIFPSISYWDEWWETFLQWVIIGIPAALALFLANTLAQAIASGTTAIIKSPPDAGGAIFALIFSYSLPFIFLIQGFFICMSSGGAVGARLKGYGDRAFAIGKGATAGAAVGFSSGFKGGWSDSKEGGGGTLANLKSGIESSIRVGGRRTYRAIGTEGKSEEEALKGWKNRNLDLNPKESKIETARSFAKPSRIDSATDKDIAKIRNYDEKQKEALQRKYDPGRIAAAQGKIMSDIGKAIIAGDPLAEAAARGRLSDFDKKVDKINYNLHYNQTKL